MTDDAPLVLYIEDDERLATLTTRYLRKHGAVVDWYGSGEGALASLDALDPDVIVLDLMLPGANGHEICRALRARTHAPIIMVSALDEEADRVLGLEGGADDYVTKPFSARELVARIRAHVRRSRQLPGPVDDRIEVDGLVLDAGRQQALLADVDIMLTPPEFALLWALAERRGHILSRSRLLELARGRGDDVFDRAIDVLVSRIRQKLGDDPKVPRWIRTVRGAGYVFLSERS